MKEITKDISYIGVNDKTLTYLKINAPYPME